ncbi:MAG: hypothetical protein KF681_13450 [Bdellovibrionaceae bacterium]|nr:hypothetical protein [Pseudobdellovibrionaceae bacterium]
MNNSPLEQDPTRPANSPPPSTEPPTNPAPNTGKVHWRTPSRPIRSDALKKGRNQPLPAFTYN